MRKPKIRFHRKFTHKRPWRVNAILIHIMSKVIDQTIQYRNDEEYLERNDVQAERVPATELREIEANDGRTMYQRWDVVYNLVENKVVERNNYKQLKGRRAYAGSHKPKDKRDDRNIVQDGTVTNPELAEQYGIRTTFNIDGETYSMEYTEEKVGNMMKDVADDDVDDSEFAFVDQASGRAITIGEIRRAVESSDGTVIAYQT